MNELKVLLPKLQQRHFNIFLLLCTWLKIIDMDGYLTMAKRGTFCSHYTDRKRVEGGIKGVKEQKKEI